MRGRVFAGWAPLVDFTRCGCAAACLTVVACFSDVGGGSGDDATSAGTGDLTAGTTPSSSGSGTDSGSGGTLEATTGASPCDENGVLDGDETDVDCGGSCPPCQSGQMCMVREDCEVGVCDDEVCAMARSCLDIPQHTGPARIRPEGAMEALDVFCGGDEGGGWTLILAYTHTAGGAELITPGTFPVDPDAGQSHASLGQLQLLPFDALRFECTSSAHSRRLHFVTVNIDAVGYIRGDNANPGNGVAWTLDVTPMADHSANLPLSAIAGFGNVGTADQGDLRITTFPFYLPGVAHWAVGAEDDRWECDDFRMALGSADTVHRVWAR